MEGQCGGPDQTLAPEPQHREKPQLPARQIQKAPRVAVTRRALGRATQVASFLVVEILAGARS